MLTEGLPATRTNPLAKYRLLYCGLNVAQPPAPRAGRRNAAGRMPRHPGKTIRRSGERMHSLNRSFFVFIAPVGSRFRPSSFMRKPLCFSMLPHRRMGAGTMSLPRGYRGRGAPCFGQAAQAPFRSLSRCYANTHMTANTASVTAVMAERAEDTCFLSSGRSAKIGTT